MSSNRYILGEELKNPARYKQGPIECWDYIGRMPFLEASAIKYISRHNLKNGKEDLEKAKIFIDKIIEVEYNGD